MFAFLKREKATSVVPPQQSMTRTPKQTAVATAGRKAFDALGQDSCADIWVRIITDASRRAGRQVRLSERGEMVSALYYYADLLEASRNPSDEATAITIRAILRRPFRLERALATYAEEVKSPHADHCKAPRTLQTFAGLVLALRTMRDRPDLLID
ncbi:hypothetical protein ACOI1H_16140 [Loktanella sp. DJP18]|uniref:hypothetical protein n=1 Tax=Loktanella sp. DJP18 TaxID=3409788 RepID=UPI003BB517C0